MQFPKRRSSMSEILLVCSTCPVSVLMRMALLGRLRRYVTLKTWHIFMLDFICIVMPGVFCMTIFSTYQDIFLAFLFCVAGVFLVLIIEDGTKTRQTCRLPADSKPPLLDICLSRRRRFISVFRAYTLLAAVIAILGVDFYQIFPRRFRKREKYGVGLMDVGIGGFMVANGVVCKETRPGFRINGCLSARLKHILSVFRSTIPLWILGLARALLAWLTGYHVHPSEYGLYWNFFFTLAAVQITTTVLLTIFPPKSCFILALIIGAAYQYALQVFELRQFVLKGSDGANSREGFLNANREGLFSCFGHLSINLASAAVGRILSNHESRYKDWLKSFVWLLVIVSLLWMVIGHMEPTIEAVSRRMANLAYVIWMLAHQLSLLCGFFFVDLLETAMMHSGLLDEELRLEQREIEVHQSTFSLMEAVNRNGLLLFLLANLLTGLVNVTIDTKQSSTVVSSLVLLSYMLVLSLTAAVLHVRGITLRF